MAYRFAAARTANRLLAGTPRREMARSVVVLDVRNSRRADAILDGLAERLRIRYFRPDESGRAEFQSRLDGRDAYAEIARALDATADDWREHITILEPEQ